MLVNIPYMDPMGLYQDMEGMEDLLLFVKKTPENGI